MCFDLFAQKVYGWLLSHVFKSWVINLNQLHAFKTTKTIVIQITLVIICAMLIPDEGLVIIVFWVFDVCSGFGYVSPFQFEAIYYQRT